MKIVSLFFFLTLFYSLSCNPSIQSPEEIINRCIAAHGGALYDDSIVDFDFRGRHYKIERDQGLYKYHRIFSDSTGNYHDVLTNEGFQRTKDEALVELDDEWIRRYSNSVNSVAYFSLLPFGLNDPAVNRTNLGEEQILGVTYHRIQITFDQEGGGEDFEDVFVYWIRKDNYLVDYFGYSYVSDGGGIRFRQAVNQRRVNGVVFSDYINYKSEIEGTHVVDLGTKFANDSLERLSEIRLENLEVNRYSDR